ncbi:MAG: hypothetical protein KF894_31785 [Labilithrix sp.]|nr:hypothetical protein [Labilithrix sp.]
MATQTSKAKRIDAPPKKPSVARAEIVDKATRGRFEAELDAALKRKPTSEVKLGGALRAVARLSPALRGSLVDAAQVMVRRGSYGRELYGAVMRTLGEAEDKHLPALLKSALAADDAGGNATLSAASFCRDTSLTAPLAKLAASRQSHLAFGAETARVCRRESNGAHLTAIAPMIKESHRIALCVELFVPLARSAPVPVHVGPALSVLRGAERHLGRWLVLADVATKAGDDGPLLEATQKAEVGPTSARAAWALVAWALSETRASVDPALPPVAPPATRPTVELVARLSDRPSADRDTTFLFRMARARAFSCKPMLEGLVKSEVLADELSVRAASFLARDHGREDMKGALLDCALNAKRDELRGLAVAALWDSASGPTRAETREKARDLSDELVASRCLSSVAWGALVRAAHASHREADFVVVTETPLRWIQWGWLE